MRGGLAQLRHRLLVQRPDRFGGRAHDQRVIVEGLALGHKRAGADQAATPDLRAIEHDRAHADQRALADGAAVQHHIVADGAFLADREGRAHVDVQRARFLNVGARAYIDRLVVATQDRAEPDADVEAEPDVADHAGARRNPEKTLRREGRPAAIERIERHGRPPAFGTNRARLRAAQPAYSSPSRSTSRIAICSVKLEAAGSSAEMTPRKSPPLLSSTESVLLTRPTTVSLSFSNRRRR